MSVSIKRVLSVAVVFLLALGIARAATHRWEERQQAFRKECQAELQKLGLTRDAAKAKYPTPEIQMVTGACVAPGATAEAVVTGKFSPGSKFFIENDNIEIVKEALTGSQYRATLRAAAGIGPETAAVAIMSPATAQSDRYEHGVRVAGKFEWTLEASNGWKVVARSLRTAPCPPDNSVEDPYEIAFYARGQVAPFEKVKAKLHFSIWEDPNFRFSIEKGALAGMEDMESLGRKMQDPKLSDAERQKLMEHLQGMMSKMGDMAYMKELQAKQEQREQQFGCDVIELGVAAGGAVTGSMRCSQKVGRDLVMKGTLTTLK